MPNLVIELGASTILLQNIEYTGRERLDSHKPERASSKRPKTKDDIYDLPRPAIVYINGFATPELNNLRVVRGLLRQSTLADIVRPSKRDTRKTDVKTIWTGIAPCRDAENIQGSLEPHDWRHLMDDEGLAYHLATRNSTETLQFSIFVENAESGYRTEADISLTNHRRLFLR